MRAKGYVFPKVEPTPSIFLSPSTEGEDKKKRYKTIKIVRELHSGRLLTPEEQKEGGLKFVRVSKEELLQRRKQAKEAKEAEEVDEAKQEPGEKK